jgi:hypothetical protein
MLLVTVTVTQNNRDIFLSKIVNTLQIKKQLMQNKLKTNNNVTLII